MGRPWPLPGEPLFTEQDTLEALELQELEDRQCSGCGNDLLESSDRKNRDRYSVTTQTCFACQAAEHAVKAKRAALSSTTFDLAGVRFIAYLDD